MTSPSPSAALADPLETLAGAWRNALAAQSAREVSAPDLHTVRSGLFALAERAEEGNCGGVPQALHRLALLSEVWECLQSDPGQEEAASEVAGFCTSAMTLLAHTQQKGGDLEGAALGIIRQSDERWSDYLSLVDPLCAGSAPAGESACAEEQGSLPDDEPSALDAQTLLRLIAGAEEERAEPVPAKSSLPMRHRFEEPTSAPREAQRADPALDRSAPAEDASIRLPQVPAASIRSASERALEIPPLPSGLDLDLEMKEAFLADASELSERICNLALELNRDKDARGVIDELSRCFHTLKGAAGSVGFSDLAALVHELEERLRQASGEASQELSDMLYQVIGYLEDFLGCLRGRPGGAAESPVRSAVAPGAIAASAPGPVAEKLIRVPVARFDELTDLASELIVQGRFWLSQAESIRTFAATVRASRNRLVASLDRLHEAGLAREGRRPAASRDASADLPGQMSRLTEQADDMAVLAESALATAGPMADRGDSLVRISHQLWDSFQSLRIVPIRGLFHRLARVAQDAARVEGKQAEVVLAGEETGVDRDLQDKAFEPLLHVVRNAVGHGIEPPIERTQAGKPVSGRVTLEARREGNTLVIAVLDDGKGLDTEAIVAKARRMGWLGADETPSAERIHGFIFHPGFSTKSQANAVSGRGVGMDVIAREVSKLRGTIDLTSQPGRGTRITLRLPARLALEPALIVRVAGQGFAVPAAQIESAQPLEPRVATPGAAGDLGGTNPASLPISGSTVLFRDQGIPVVFARETLEIARSSAALWPKLVVVRTGSRLVGLVVDAIERTEDLVIKPLGALLAGHPLVSGTSLSVNAELISVLNPAGLECWLNMQTACAPGPSAQGPTLEPSGGPRGGRATVLVVDDSISVRRGVARLLRGLGLEVHEASDGREALSRLRSFSYGLVVTDLEMPRLDGFALLAEIKRAVPISAIPVVVASTRNDPETRQRVLGLGAEALLAKPVDPHELARTALPLLGATRQ